MIFTVTIETLQKLRTGLGMPVYYEEGIDYYKLYMIKEGQIFKAEKYFLVIVTGNIILHL